jgi:hypothetical protein
MESGTVYLRAILATVARQTFPPDKLAELVGRGKKQHLAFNLFDGSRAQSDVAKALSLDSGNLSKLVNRWIESGIAVRVGEGRESRIVHVYPLPTSTLGKESDDNG